MRKLESTVFIQLGNLIVLTVLFLFFFIFYGSDVDFIWIHVLRQVAE